MDILIVGALAWNPERIIALSDQGHRLYGLWSRTMAWEQGPYPFAEGRIAEVDIDKAIDLLCEHRIDIVYSLFQVYDPKLWSQEAAPGVEDAWVQLKRLVLEKARGAFSAPIVRHWGFDVHNLNLPLVRALDGQIFCNRQKKDYWTLPRSAGGCGLNLGCEGQEIAFMDSDLPSQRFMNERFSPKLSATDAEIHTVCIGRPLGIDIVRAARCGIHVHVYGNNFDDITSTIARGLSTRRSSSLKDLLADYLHIHPSIQPTGASLERITTEKERWVEEFSRYDAGWSYIGSPLPWSHLEDQAAIPNRHGTYMLAGLPIITENLPGFYRYDSLAENDVAIDFSPANYQDLARRLREKEVLSRKTGQARLCRKKFSFEATVPALMRFFENVQGRAQRDRKSYSLGNG